jgi:hypothetical protein
MVPVLALVLLSASQLNESRIDADQFARLIASLHAEVQDVSLVFEGRLRGVPRGTSVEEIIRDDGPPRPGVTYQGSYAYRAADGATFLETFELSDSSGKVVEMHNARAMLNNRLSSLTRFPERRNEHAEVRSGIPGSLNMSGSPERICYLWYLKRLEDPRLYGYEYMGWEDFGGHMCLKVQFDEAPMAGPQKPDRPVIRFWIDMARGGHPLQVEFRNGRGVRMRSTGIQLARLTLPDGKGYWFPVRGRTEYFLTTSPNYSSVPVGVETCYVLDGTVKFNQGFSDRFFSLDWQGKRPESQGLAQRRKQFRKPVPRNDPEGIKKRLERQLAEANAQAKQIEASSPAREAEGWIPAVQYGLGALGISLVCGAAIWKWRAR